MRAITVSVRGSGVVVVLGELLLLLVGVLDDVAGVVGTGFGWVREESVTVTTTICTGTVTGGPTAGDWIGVGDGRVDPATRCAARTLDSGSSRSSAPRVVGTAGVPAFPTLHPTTAASAIATARACTARRDNVVVVMAFSGSPA